MKKSYFKTSIMTSAIAIVLFGSAHAAQIPVKENWTGIYGGLEAGVIFNDFAVTSEQLGFTEESNTCNGRSNHPSFFPGVLLGYSKQMHNDVVLGLEGDFTYNVDQSDVFDCSCDFNSNVYDGFTFKNRLQGSLRGRLGYALFQENFLPFLMTGVSVADLGLSYQNEAGDDYSTARGHAGWLVGGGLEWKSSEHWSVRAEYFYVDYGHVINMPIPVIYGLIDSNGHADLDLHANNIGIAVSYWI